MLHCEFCLRRKPREQNSKKNTHVLEKFADIKKIFYLCSLKSKPDKQNLTEPIVMLEVLKYTIPALIVLLAAWLVMSKEMQNEDARRSFEVRRNAQNVTQPIRLRAYERLALMLERTTPEFLLLNMQLQNMTAGQLQIELLHKIREEFDHNISQQIYVNDDTWMAIISARETMLGFVNTCTSHVGNDAPAMTLAQVMLTAYNSNGETNNQKAMNLLKQEVREII